MCAYACVYMHMCLCVCICMFVNTYIYIYAITIECLLCDKSMYTLFYCSPKRLINNQD